VWRSELALPQRRRIEHFGITVDIQRAHWPTVNVNSMGEVMLDIEETSSETDASTLEDERTQVPDVDPDPTGAVAVGESPTAAAARMLELAAGTADQLVADAEQEAESLVTTAQATADALLEASRREARQVAAELALSKAEQATALDRERATALAGLADEKAALEAQIAALRQLQSEHRSTLPQHLTEQLSFLDASLPEPPAAVGG